MPVTGSYTRGTNGCNISILTGPLVYTNSSGRFVDRYGNTQAGQGIPACKVVPTCITYRTQKYIIADVSFSHAVTWRCDNVVVNR